jgi:hypothetical protein
MKFWYKMNFDKVKLNETQHKRANIIWFYTPGTWISEFLGAESRRVAGCQGLSGRGNGRSYLSIEFLFAITKRTENI